MIGLFHDAIVFIAGALVALFLPKFGGWLKTKAAALWTGIKAMFAKKGA